MAFQPGSQTTLSQGTTLGQGRYRVGSIIAEGGMGAIYRAWDFHLLGLVAIKEMRMPVGVPPTARQALQAQFMREAQAMASLRHPNLVRVIDSFEERGNAYLVMDYVEGVNLEQMVKQQGPLPEQAVVAWATKLLDALEHCHSQGIIHRDIKPQNLIVRTDNGIVLVDFGLTKTWSSQAPGDTASVIKGMGTPGYAPPEQYGHAPGRTDQRSDLYSVGATMYYCLTGEVPLDAPQRQAIPHGFPPVRHANPTLSARTAQVVTQALELALARRFQSAREMREALDPARLPASGPLLRLLKGRPWAWVLSGLLLLVVLVIGVSALGGRLWPSPTPTHTPASEPTHAPIRDTPTPEPTHAPAHDTPTPVPQPQTVEWGRNLGREAGICIDGCGQFIPWEALKPEIERELLPQIAWVPAESTVVCKDWQGQADWVVSIRTPAGVEIGDVWFGRDPLNDWAPDGKIRVGKPGPPATVLNTFQRYSDNSYRAQ